MSLKRVRWELARTPDFPNGSALHGYDFVALLDDGGQLQSVDWPRLKGACTVRRFWDKADDEHGSLIHHRDGSWAFSYALGEDDDEPIFKFDRHRFTVGEYVTITEHDGIVRPFRVAGVEPAIRRV